MGLAAPKNRTRISNDPQNITWAKDTSRFGHKILTSQGWTPGSTLGAANAPHAAHYTAASASHIRVALKDDNLGLGAKRGSENAENFGLAGLASILGRLNGNEADVKKEEERMEKVEQRAYVYRKYGLMNFVSAGFLVGGEIKPKSEIQVKKEITVKEEPDSETDDTKSKKRKRSRDIKEEPEDSDEEEPTLKRKKKSMNLRDAADAEEKSKKSKKDKKDKKEKKDKKSSSSSSKSTSAVDTPAPVSTVTEEEPISDKARRKAEKRARKEEKKLKKALKKAAKEAAQSKSNPADSSSESEDDDEESTPTSSIPTSGVSTPASGASGLSFNVGGRHAVRQRYIRQKKMAGMDPQALKEIFMIKTPS